MGLRCSLFGHAFGEPVTEREREQRGNEEVVTTRKLRSCSRCGAETVLSENTEVRHLEAETATSTTERPGTSPEPATNEPPEPTPDSAQEDTTSPASSTAEPDVAELVDSAESADESAVASGSEVTTSGSAGPDETTGSVEATSDPATSAETDEVTPAADADDAKSPAETDDAGIIIDEGPDESDQATGSSPESAAPSESSAGPEDSVDQAPGQGSVPPTDTTNQQAETTESAHSESARSESTVEGPGPDPEAHRASTGTDALDDVGTSPDSRGADGDTAAVDPTHRTPSEPADPAPDQPVSEPGTRDVEAGGRDDPSFQFGLEEDSSGSGGAAANRGPSGIASEGPLDVDEQAETPYDTLQCPECGFSESSRSSLRAGDICPECHRGYLAGRQ